MVTGAALATVNRLPVLLLPGDSYATRHQGPVLQQLQHPIEADVSVNDAFRPVSPVLRPDHPARAAAHRAAGGHAGARRPGRDRRRGAVAAAGHPVRTPTTSRPSSSPSGTGSIRRPAPDAGRDRRRGSSCSPQAKRPLIIAGGGVIYSERHRRARARSPTPSASRSPRPSPARARSSSAPGGSSAASAWKGPRPTNDPGPRGRPGAHRRVPADRLRHRLALDLRQPRRAVRQHQRQRPRRRPARRHSASSATPSAPWPRWPTAVATASTRPTRGGHRTEELTAAWALERAAALDPDQPFDKSAVPRRLRRRHHHRRGADPGSDHRRAAGARPSRRRDHRRRRRPARRPAEGVGRHRRPHLPPGVRLLLHGLRDPGRDRRAAGRTPTPTPGSPRSSATAPS